MIPFASLMPQSGFADVEYIGGGTSTGTPSSVLSSYGASTNDMVILLGGQSGAALVQDDLPPKQFTDSSTGTGAFLRYAVLAAGDSARSISFGGSGSAVFGIYRGALASLNYIATINSTGGGFVKHPKHAGVIVSGAPASSVSSAAGLSIRNSLGGLILADHLSPTFPQYPDGVPFTVTGGSAGIAELRTL